MTEASGIRCWVFDFDGTLVDSNAIKRAVYDEVLADVPGGSAAVVRILRESPRDDRHAVFAKVAAILRAQGAAAPPRTAAWIAAYSEICEQRVSACPAVPHAVDTLAWLGERHPLYIASATPEEALVRIVRARGWLGYFRGVFGKPRTKVENLRRAAQQEGLAPEQLGYVGDGAVDREAAAAFGCHFLGYGSPPGSLATGPLALLVDEVAARSVAE